MVYDCGYDSGAGAGAGAGDGDGDGYLEQEKLIVRKHFSRKENKSREKKYY